MGKDIHGCWRRRPAMLQQAEPHRAPTAKATTTPTGVLGVLETQLGIAAYRVLEMTRPPGEDAGTGDCPCYDRRRPRRRPLLQPTGKNAGTSSLFAGTGIPFCCDSEQRLVRMATTIFFAGTSSLFCWNQRPILLQQRTTTGEDGDGVFLFCWN